MLVNPALVILNPRRIPACIDAFKALDIPKVWLSSYSELQLRDVFPAVIDTDFTHFVAVSDDVVVTQAALDTVLGLLRNRVEVATGYCNLDQQDNRDTVNLTKTPLRGARPSLGMYDFYRRGEVKGQITSFFGGMCLTGMSKALWRRFPFDCYVMRPGVGCCSDYSLSWRLQQAGIRIVSHEDAFVEHLKTRWNETDPLPERQLIWAEPEVRWE